MAWAIPVWLSWGCREMRRTVTNLPYKRHILFFFFFFYHSLCRYSPLTRDNLSLWCASRLCGERAGNVRLCVGASLHFVASRPLLIGTYAACCSPAICSLTRSTDEVILLPWRSAHSKGQPCKHFLGEQPPTPFSQCFVFPLTSTFLFVCSGCSCCCCLYIR